MIKNLITQKKNKLVEKKKFVSVSSFIAESVSGKQKVFAVENDQDRDPKLGGFAFTDIIGKVVEIDGVDRIVYEVTDPRKSFGSLHPDRYAKGQIIGLNVK